MLFEDLGITRYQYLCNIFYCDQSFEKRCPKNLNKFIAKIYVYKFTIFILNLQRTSSGFVAVNDVKLKNYSKLGVNLQKIF